MNNKWKIIGTALTIATFTAGGVVGGTVLASQNTAQQVAEAEDKGYQEGHKDGYEQGSNENTGYTEEDLENAKDEGREEVENEYLAVLSIVTDQNKLDSWVTDDINLYSSYQNSKPGLVLHKKSNNTYQMIFDKGFGYRFIGFLGEEALICSNNIETQGLYGLNCETLELKTYTTSGYDFQTYDQVNGRLIVTCRGLQDSMELKLVEIKENGECEILIQSETGNDVQMIESGKVVIESGTQNLYLLDEESFTYSKVEDIDVNIEWASVVYDIVSGNKSIIVLTNQENKLAVIDAQTMEYKSQDLRENVMADGLNYVCTEDGDNLFYRTETSLWQYNLTNDTNTLLLEGIQDFRLLTITSNGMYFYCLNTSGTYDLYGLQYGRDITKHLENCTEMFETEFVGDFVRIFVIKDSEEHQYKLDFSTNTIEQEF